MALETLTYTNPHTGTSITFGDTSLPNVLYNGITGGGLPPIDNFVVDTAYQPGAQFVRTKKKPAVLTVHLVVQGYDTPQQAARVQLFQTVDTILGVLDPQIAQVGTLVKTLADGSQRKLKNVQYVAGFELQDKAENYAYISLDLIFEAYDPTWYSNLGYSQSVGSSTDTGGFLVPFKIPLLVSGQPSATVTVTNHGNVDAHPVFTFTGPLSNAIVQNVATGESFSLALNLNPGDQLIFDTGQGSVTFTPFGGVSTPQYSAFGGAKQWIRLVPGANSITFARDNPANNQCVIAWSDTWNHG